jgi:hypothetical protein
LCWSEAKKKKRALHLCEEKMSVSTRSTEKDEGGTMLPCAREKTKWRLGFSLKGERGAAIGWGRSDEGDRSSEKNRRDGHRLKGEQRERVREAERLKGGEWELMIALRSEKDKQKGGIGVESVRRVRERWIDFTEEKGNDRREMGHGYGE